MMKILLLLLLVVPAQADEALLKAENAALRAQVKSLRAEIARLKAGRPKPKPTTKPTKPTKPGVLDENSPRLWSDFEHFTRQMALRTLVKTERPSEGPKAWLARRRLVGKTVTWNLGGRVQTHSAEYARFQYARAKRELAAGKKRKEKDSFTTHHNTALMAAWEPLLSAGGWKFSVQSRGVTVLASGKGKKPSGRYKIIVARKPLIGVAIQLHGL